MRKPERLRMSGAMGMAGAVAGIIDIRLTPKGRGTVVRLTHRAVGEVSEETRARSTQAWTVLLQERLKAYVERGVRSGLKR